MGSAPSSNSKSNGKCLCKEKVYYCLQESDVAVIGEVVPSAGGGASSKPAVLLVKPHEPPKKQQVFACCDYPDPYTASRHGHLACLEYADKSNIPEYFEYSIGMYKSVWSNPCLCENAAMGNHLDCLKFLHMRKVPYEKKYMLYYANGAEVRDYIMNNM